MSNNNSPFRERFTEVEATLKYKDIERTILPSTEGLKFDTKFDISQLEGFTGPAIEVKGVAEKVKPAGMGDLRIDADLSKLDEGIQKIQKQRINEKIRTWIEKAQKLIAQQKFREAVKVLDEALKADATSAQVLFLKGYCFFGLGEHEAALAILNDAQRYAHDPDMLILVLVLHAACVRAITAAFEAKLAVLITKKRFAEAIALVESELRRQPSNVALLYHRCVVLFLMGKMHEAKESTLAAKQRVDPENANLFEELLNHFVFEEHQKYLEAARQALRQGDPAGAQQKLQPCRKVLAGFEQYEAVRSYIKEKSPQGFFRSIFSSSEKVLTLTEASREKLLLWLLAEELNKGVSAMNIAKFDQAATAFANAAKIDNRCRTICFLHGLSIFNSFQQALQNQDRTLDLDHAITSLETSAELFAYAAANPNLAQQSKNLHQTVLSYQAQLKEVRQERAHREQESKPVNELIKDFNGLMDNLQKSPIRSTNELESAERKLRDLRQRCDKLRKNRTREQGREILDQILAAIDRNLEQVDTIRDGVRNNEQVQLINNCVSMFNGMMQYFNNHPIQTLQQLEQANKMVNAISDMVKKARAGERRGSEGLQVLDQLDEAIQNLRRQLSR